VLRTGLKGKMGGIIGKSLPQERKSNPALAEGKKIMGDHRKQHSAIKGKKEPAFRPLDWQQGQNVSVRKNHEKGGKDALNQWGHGRFLEKGED